jgi:hypothetical protein
VVQPSWWPSQTLGEAVGRSWVRDPTVFGSLYREPVGGGQRVKWGTTIWAKVEQVTSQPATRVTAAFPAERVSPLQAFRTKDGSKVVIVSGDGEMILVDGVAYQRQDVPLATRVHKAKALGLALPVPAILPKVSAADAHRALLAQVNRSGGAAFGAKSRLVNSTWIFERMRRAGIPLARYAINVGCNNGVSIDPVYELVQAGWSSLCIEPDRGLARAAKAALAKTPGRVQVHNGRLEVEGIVALFDRYKVPYKEADGGVDFIKLDIDNIDAYLMDRVLSVARPKLFLVEYNVRFPPPVHFTIDFPNTYTFRGDYHCRKFGTSLEYLDKMVGRKHGYVAIYGEVNDVWFVDRQYLHAFGRPPSTAELYCDGTLHEAWIDAMAFFFAPPNKDRNELALVLGDAAQAAKAISTWMINTPDERRCNPGVEWAFGITVPGDPDAAKAARSCQREPTT